MLLPVFKTCSPGSPASCEVTLLAKSRVFRRSRIRYVMLWELGVGTHGHSMVFAKAPAIALIALELFRRRSGYAVKI